MHRIVVSCLLVAVGAGVQAQLTLIEIGGVPKAGNLALWSTGASPFASSALAGYPYHSIQGLNDGWYGNNGNINYGDGSGTSGASWIAAGAPVTAGVQFMNPTTVAEIAWGRDSSQTYSERTSGQYFVEVSLDGANWTPVGDVTLGDFTPNDSKRHLYSFAPQSNVRYLRLRINGNSGVCVEEIEAYGVVPEPGGIVTLSLGLFAIGRGSRRR